MNSTHSIHLIVDPPASGVWNMAVDQALLESASEAQIPTLRIYRWERPTLSLGYFQRYEDRHSHLASESADVVRRQSGGGAILHDQEITYSLIVPEGHPMTANPQSLYETIHLGLIGWLNGFLGEGKRLALSSPESAHSTGNKPEDAFLCFQRRSPGDVVLSGDGSETDHKVVGSAQRRRHGAVLQHGSIIWSTSILAQEICGFANLTKSKTTLSDAQNQLVEQLPSIFGMELVRTCLSGTAMTDARKLQEIRYLQHSWTKRR